MELKEVVAEIKRREPIANVIGEYVSLRKSGQNYIGVCPFHDEKTPSFYVSPSREAFKCFGCGASGDLFTFLEKKTGRLFGELLTSFASKHQLVLDNSFARLAAPGEDRKKALLRQIVQQVAVFFKDELKLNAAPLFPLDYLKTKRCLPQHVVDQFDLGSGSNDERLLQFLKAKNIDFQLAEEAGLVRQGHYGPYSVFAGRLIVPIKDASGAVLGFAGRLIDETKSDKAKYINSAASVLFNKGELLFGLHEAQLLLSKGAPAVVVEGYFDVIALSQLGFAAVATCGTQLTHTHLELLKKHGEVIVLCFDKDQAGQIASRKVFRQLLGEGFHVRIAELSGKDPDEVWRSRRGLELKASILGAGDALEYMIGQSARNLMGGLVERVAAIDSLLAYVAVIGRPLMREHYLKLISRTFNENERVLHEELQKRGGVRVQAPVVAKPVARNEARPVQKFSPLRVSDRDLYILRAVIAFPGLVVEFPKKLPRDMHPYLQDLIENIRVTAQNNSILRGYDLLRNIRTNPHPEWLKYINLARKESRFYLENETRKTLSEIFAVSSPPLAQDLSQA